MIKKIIFAYNADSGILNSLVDYVHKIAFPSTYPSLLCAVTFGNLGKKIEWKQFISSLDIEVEFFHRDEFKKKYGIDGEFPSAYISGTDLKVLISKEEMNAVKNLMELMDLVRNKLQMY